MSRVICYIFRVVSLSVSEFGKQNCADMTL
nr:MAG TPA: hypothetical protein [Caudoviricetes sp.]